MSAGNERTEVASPTRRCPRSRVPPCLARRPAIDPGRGCLARRQHGLADRRRRQHAGHDRRCAELVRASRAARFHDDWLCVPGCRSWVPGAGGAGRRHGTVRGVDHVGRRASWQRRPRRATPPSGGSVVAWSTSPMRPWDSSGGTGHRAAGGLPELHGPVTDDGGDTWTGVPDAPCDTAVWWAGQVGVVQPDRGAPAIRVTRDGGRTWRDGELPGVGDGVQLWPRALVAVGSDHYRLAGTYFRDGMSGSPPVVALETADGGLTWHEAWRTSLLDGGQLQWLTAFDADHWLALASVSIATARSRRPSSRKRGTAAKPGRRTRSGNDRRRLAVVG